MSQIAIACTVLVRLSNDPILNEQRRRPGIVLAVNDDTVDVQVFLHPLLDRDLLDRGHALVTLESCPIVPGDGVGSWSWPEGVETDPRHEVHGLLDELIDQALGEGVALPAVLDDVAEFIDNMLAFDKIIGGPAGFALEAVDGPAVELLMQSLLGLFRPRDEKELKAQAKTASARKTKRTRRRNERRREEAARRARATATTRAAEDAIEARVKAAKDAAEK